MVPGDAPVLVLAIPRSPSLSLSPSPAPALAAATGSIDQASLLLRPGKRQQLQSRFRLPKPFCEQNQRQSDLRGPQRLQERLPGLEQAVLQVQGVVKAVSSS